MKINSSQPTAPFVIATRESRLALWQAEHVKALLESGGHATNLLGMTTKGDQILDRTLSKVGGKGLFVKELELALEEGRADLAVHSLKDVPMELPAGFELACVMEREDPRDAFVSPHYATLADLPQGSVVGTSSLRRQALLQALRPDLKIEPLRGNLDTRLRKLDEGQYAGIVLAAAGLKRLGLEARIRQIFEPEFSNPILIAKGKSNVSTDALVQVAGGAAGTERDRQAEDQFARDELALRRQHQQQGDGSLRQQADRENPPAPPAVDQMAGRQGQQ